MNTPPVATSPAFVSLDGLFSVLDRDGQLVVHGCSSSHCAARIAEIARVWGGGARMVPARDVAHLAPDPDREP